MFRICSVLTRSRALPTRLPQACRASSLFLRVADISQAPCAAALWSQVLQKPFAKANAVAALLQRFASLRPEPRISAVQQDECAANSTAVPAAAALSDADRNLAMFMHGFYLPEIVELLPHLDTVYAGAGSGSADSSRLGFAHQLVLEMRDGSLGLSAIGGAGKEQLAAIRGDFLRHTVEYVAEHCHSWPVDVICKALEALMLAECDRADVYQQLLACSQLPPSAVVAFVQKVAGEKLWQCSVARQACHEVLASQCARALESGDTSAATSALTALADDKGDVGKLPVRVLRALLGGAEEPLTEHGTLDALCVLDVLARQSQLTSKPAGDGDELFRDVAAFAARGADHTASLPLEACEQGVLHLASMTSACARSYDALVKDLVLKPLAFGLVGRLHDSMEEEAEVARAHVLAATLQVMHFLRWNDGGVLGSLRNDMLNMVSCRLDPTLMVNSCYFLANLCRLPEGILSTVSQDHWPNLHFDQQVKLVLTSAMIGEFLAAPWLALVSKMADEDFSREFHQFTAWCLMVLDAYVVHEFFAHDQRAPLLPGKCGTAAKSLCSSSPSWTAAGSVGFMYELVRHVGGEYVWRSNPSEEFFFLSCMAAVVLDDEGRLVAADRSFDASSMYPVYFVQGRICNTGELDGMQKLLCRICFLRAAFCIQVKNGQADDAIFKSLEDVQLYVIAQESLEPVRRELGPLVLGYRRDKDAAGAAC